MLKKVVISILIVLTMLGSVAVFASEYEGVVAQHEQKQNETELVDMQQSTKGKLQDYIAKYGSVPYGVAAMILNVLRIYSIPCCFVGIAVGSIYQYVLGIRKLDTQEKGLHMMVAFITILVICQILPLAFAIVVKFGRG